MHRLCTYVHEIQLFLHNNFQIFLENKFGGLNTPQTKKKILNLQTDYVQLKEAHLLNDYFRNLRFLISSRRFVTVLFDQFWSIGLFSEIFTRKIIDAELCGCSVSFINIYNVHYPPYDYSSVLYYLDLISLSNSIIYIF